MLNFQKKSFHGNRITKKILTGNSSIFSGTGYFPQSLSETLLWVKSRSMFSVIDTDCGWNLDLVISSGICCTPSSECTNGGCALFFPTLLLTSYIVLAVYFPLCLFSSCEIRFHCLTCFGYTRCSWQSDFLAIGIVAQKLQMSNVCFVCKSTQQSLLRAIPHAYYW